MKIFSHNNGAELNSLDFRSLFIPVCNRFHYCHLHRIRVVHWGFGLHHCPLYRKYHHQQMDPGTIGLWSEENLNPTPRTIYYTDNSELTVHCPSGQSHGLIAAPVQSSKTFDISLFWHLQDPARKDRIKKNLIAIGLDWKSSSCGIESIIYRYLLLS